VIWLPDSTVEHLVAVAGWPEFSSDRYEVTEEIGRGGMGTVYAALDHALGREVAIKIGNALPSTELQARLTREARVIARLEHPGIVPVHDVGMLADGRPFYVMKRVHGRTLQAYLEQAPPLAERLRIFERVCEAVSFAHAHEIIHRDLKPQNVMVGEFGEVMVMDWGVARLLDDLLEPATGSTRGVPPDEHPQATHAGTVLGTPGFMAPEQAAATGPIDRRADVYALGAMLFTLLTDRHPPADAVAAGQELSRATSVEAPLRSICRCALAAAPADRYPSVERLAEDVARFREGLSVSVHPEGPIAHARRFVRTYWTPILLVLAYIVMRALIALFARA
jgi:serine/threonine protein kinase